jgi:hypothetical protein
MGIKEEIFTTIITDVSPSTIHDSPIHVWVIFFDRGTIGEAPTVLFSLMEIFTSTKEGLSKPKKVWVIPAAGEGDGRDWMRSFM